MKKLLIGAVAVSAALLFAGANLGASPRARHDDFTLATTLHGIGLEINDHHVSEGPGGGCIHEATLRLLGQDRADFRYRVFGPDMPTAHSTSLLIAVGILAGQSPETTVGTLNGAGFNVQVRVQRADAMPRGQDVTRVVDLLRASIDVVSDRPGGGCEGLLARLDSGFAALQLAGTCGTQQDQH